MNKRVLLLFGVVLLLGGAIAAACSSDTDDLEARIEALEAQSGGSGEIAALHEQLQQANMIATLNLLDGVGFHDADDAISAGEEPPDGLNGRVLAALRAVAATDWADDLDADAETLQADLQAFFDALANRETSDVGAAAAAAHDTYHEFGGAAWTMLGDKAGVTAGEDDHDEGGEQGEGTPADEHTDDEEHTEEETPEEGG
ncbi:MAG: hypothetical protein WD939_03535 [Dehalococcoidia bacterium]